MKNIKKLVLFITMIIVVGGINVYAAGLGDQLLQPEEGWQRYDDNDSRFIYQGAFLISNNNKCYNATAHWLEVNPVAADTNIKFKFLGKKLRIIGTIYPDLTKSFVVKIDGTEYTFSAAQGDQLYQGLICEITDLAYQTHNVEIYSSDNLRYNLDAIDIDENGSLLDPTLLESPSNLIASAGNGQVSISWKAVSDADSYTILRSTTSSTVDTVIATGVKETTYVDTNVEPGVTYYYIVRAVKNGVESPDSNIASAIIENTNTAVLQIKLSTTDIYEYRITMNEVDNFMKWYIDRSNGTGLPFYSFSDESKIEPYTDINEYLIFDKIVWFKVKEYLK